jgi:AP-1 complex subunit sigma 1/2
LRSGPRAPMIQFILLTSRQGKPRLIKWFAPKSQSDMQRESRQVINMVLRRPPKACNIIEWQDYKLVYKRYASLYFITCIENTDNELMALDTIHLFVEVLDRYFGNVCELDLIFNFHKAYYILDELIISGELQETSKKAVLRYIQEQDAMMQDTKDKSLTRRN